MSSDYAYQKIWRAKNREKWNKAKRDSEKRHPDTVRARRARFREKHKEQIKQKRLAVKRAIMDYIEDFKVSAGCAVCGENYPFALDFHHLDPSEKEAGLSTIQARGWRIERVQEEIDKCIVLCANCHRKLHHGFIVLD